MLYAGRGSGIKVCIFSYSFNFIKMSEINNEEQFKEMASQLSCPAGENGIKTAENMASNNSNMILVTISSLGLKDAERVLEIGPGGGSHVPALMHQAADLLYYGIDISELMIEESLKFNQELAAAGKAVFSLSDGETLGFARDFFDKVFTVNTLYFWKDPAGYAKELLRVLKPGGVLCLAFAPKSFMEKLPFTKYTFQLYTIEEAKELFIHHGFELRELDVHNEVVTSNAGMKIEREFIVLSLQKPQG